MVQFIDNILDATQAILLSLLVKLGPFFVALMPALFTGYAIYATFEQKVGLIIALFFAVVVSLAVETVGIVATHTAIELYNGAENGTIQPVKFWIMAAMVPVYVLGVAAVIWFAGDAFTDIVRSLGIASPFLTAIVYAAVALARDLQNIKAKGDRKEAKEDRNRAEIRAEKRKERLEKSRIELEKFRIEQETKVKIAGIEVQAYRQAVESSGNVANGSDDLPEWLTVTPKDRQHFRQLAESGEIIVPDSVTGADLARMVPAVGSSRTGQNWLADIRTNGQGS